MSIDLALWNGGDELVLLVQDQMRELLDMRRDGGREEHALAPGGLLVWETLDDVLEGGHEAHIQQTISLIEDKSVEVAECVLDALVAQMIVETAWGGDQNIAAGENGTLLSVLVGASNSEGDLELWEMLQQLAGLLGNLHGELTGWRDNEEGDTGTLSALLVEHGLDGWEEESDGLSGTGLRLSEHIDALLEEVVKSSGLDWHHVVKLHVFDDGLEKNWVEKLLLAQLCEAWCVEWHRFDERWSRDSEVVHHVDVLALFFNLLVVG